MPKGRFLSEFHCKWKSHWRILLFDPNHALHVHSSLIPVSSPIPWGTRQPRSQEPFCFLRKLTFGTRPTVYISGSNIEFYCVKNLNECSLIKLTMTTTWQRNRWSISSLNVNKKKDKSPKMIALLLDSFVIQILVRLSYYFRLFSSVIVNDLKQRKK